MNIEKIEKNGTICAVVRSDEVVVTDPQSALDLLMTAKYDVGTKNIVIDGNVILPFIDRFPTDTELYRIMTTKLHEVVAEKEA